MYIAYFDESGDAGIVGSPTTWFVLACVLVNQNDWLKTLDQLVDLRTRLRKKFGISTRQEIKAINLRNGKGALKGLGISPNTRRRIFRGLMAYQKQYLTSIKIFAVAVHKANAFSNGFDPRTVAWDFSLQRVDTYCKYNGDEKAMLFPDEGHGTFIKRLVRRKRRYGMVPARWGGGKLQLPIERIIEDPNDRQSHDSYFVQLADWAAYAAHRSVYIDPKKNSDGGLWDALGGLRVLEVNKLTGGPPAIKVYP